MRSFTFRVVCVAAALAIALLLLGTALYFTQARLELERRRRLGWV